MIFKVVILELASQTVNELLITELEGIKKGNIETPAVKMTAANVKELLIKASPGRSTFDSTIVVVPAINAKLGIAHNIYYDKC